MRSGSVTLKQVAEKAGCSFSAAAKVLNKVKGSAKVGKELSARIKQVAMELGYSPNLNARRLIKGSSDAIGFVAFSEDLFKLPFWSHILAGVNQGVVEHDKDLLLIGPGNNEGYYERARRFCREKRIDALIVPWNIMARSEQKLDHLTTPIVVIYAAVDETYPNVRLDIGPGYRDAAKHLAVLGHTRILWNWMLDSDKQRQMTDRRACFETHAAQYGFVLDDIEVIRNIDKVNAIEQRTIRNAYFTLRETIRQGNLKATSIMAFNDLTAIGFVHALKDSGLRVPQDISVIGFDNLYTGLSVPQLSTICGNLKALGAKGAELACALVETPSLFQELHGQSAIVQSRFVTGKSTGPRRGP